MALYYTHAMNDAKRQAVEKKNSGGRKVTKEKQQTRQPAVNS
jgi:hypothetical protein